MNQHVPGFQEVEKDCSIPESSGFSRPKRLPTGEDDIMELLWRNGQVVVQRSTKRGGEIEVPAEQLTVRGIRSTAEEQHLFMQEDEMASWLQYPIDDSSFDRDLYAELLYSAPPPPPFQAPVTAIAPPRSEPEIRPHPAPTPPIAVQGQKPEFSPRFQNFVHFSRHPCRQQSIEPISKPLVAVARESTVVESNETPAVGRESRTSLVDFRTHTNTDCGTAALNAPGAASGKLAGGSCEFTVSSSPGGSGSSFSASVKPHRQTRKPSPAEERKRKISDADDNECRSEENYYEEGETKRQGRVLAASSSKRSRAAEVHNLSERRRRDRINEKMKALQQLIPRCSKTDKASMLDEAIEYLKSLQLQVQMMSSMGCGMVPVMYPGMQRFMPAMGMGMDMVMNRPMLPYPSMQLPGSGLPNQTSPAAHMGAGFHIPTFHLSPVLPVPDSSRIQADPTLNSFVSLDPNQPRMPNFVYPYQQFSAGLQQASQLPLPQNQAAAQRIISKETGNVENQPSAG